MAKKKVIADSKKKTPNIKKQLDDITNEINKVIKSQSIEIPEEDRHYILYAKGYYQNFDNHVLDLKLIYGKLNNIHPQKVRRINVLRKLKEIVYKYNKDSFLEESRMADVAFSLRKHSKEDILDIFIKQWLCPLRGLQMNEMNEETKEWIKLLNIGEADENIAPVTKGDPWDHKTKRNFYKDEHGDYNFDDSSDGCGTHINKHL